MTARPFDPGPRFEVRRTLGAGGMGFVYEALDRELGELVAIKTLRNADGRWLAHFKQEFRALHDLSHRNLAALGEFFDGTSEPFFTMELVRGVDFLAHVRGVAVPTAARPPSSDRLADGPTRPGAPLAAAPPVDEPRLRAALAQLAAGVHALHEAGKVHRDIKPSNILVEADGRVVLLDFGLVADLAPTRRSTGGEVVGTVAYMAPEQALARDVSPRSDWYSLGVVLYEALTGQLPHDGRTAYELILNKQQVVPVPPRELAPTAPADLDALCGALLRVDPAARPQAAEVFAALGVDVTSQIVIARAAGAELALPFVGRGAQLAALRAAFDDARDRPLVCLVTGVSGVGKSLLVDRFLAGLAEEVPDAVVLSGRCYEREVVAYKALDGIADGLARHLTRVPPAELGALLPRRPALLSRLFPVFKRVEAIAAAHAVPDVPDPHDQRLRMFAALRELFQRVAERRRLVWYIDDLQWTDADSLVLLADLLAHEEAPPVLVVATVRPVDDPGRQALLDQVARLAPTRTVAVPELSLDEARDLAARLLPGRDAATLSTIAADAGGHPLLLHELARHVDAGRAGRASSLDEMLARRIARLDAGARTLLDVLAVAGGPLAQDVAAGAAGMSIGEQVKATAVLRAAHLVRTDGTRRTDRVVTYHDRVREHVDARLDDARRRHLHERLAVALEQAGAAEHTPRALVRHARAAGRHAMAASYARAGARHAVAALAFDQAAELLATAIELGDHDAASLRALQIEQATALMHAGRGPEAAVAFIRAAEGAEPAVRFDCQRHAAEQWIITGHLEQGMAALRSSLADIGEPPAATPRRALARVVWNRGRLRLRGVGHTLRLESQVPVETLRRLDVLKAVAHGLAMIDNIRGADFNGRYLLLALRTGEARRLVGALASEVVFLASQGGAAGRRARRLYGELTRIAAACPDPVYARTWVLLADGAASFFEFQFRRAVEALDRLEEVFADGPAGLTYEKNNARVFRVHALRMMGAVRQHGGSIAELIRTNRHRGDRYLETTLRLLQVQSLVARDQRADARAAIEDAAWTPPEEGFHLQHWYELMARSELALYEDDTDAADRLAPTFTALRGSLLLRVRPVRSEAMSLQGRLLLAAARARPRAGAVAAAARIAGALDREDTVYARACAALLRAALGTLGGPGRDADEAAHLRRAIELAAQGDMAWHLAAARDRLGQLLGGDEGADLRAAAARFAADQGFADAARMFAIVAPGFPTR